jgi:hypothetical protein
MTVSYHIAQEKRARRVNARTHVFVAGYVYTLCTQAVWSSFYST